MLEKIKGISNPLTVIAIFASITEVGGTIVLPFLSTTNQAQYMWFLIIFPAVLVLLFFGTLNFNHQVLYAPSDYREDSSFLAASRIQNNLVTTSPGVGGEVGGIRFAEDKDDRGAPQ
jgi:hypothetical protein